MRRYDDAVPALDRGRRPSTPQHNLESNRRYAVAWLARCRFDLGAVGRGRAARRDAIAGVAHVADRPLRRAQHARLAAGPARRRRCLAAARRGAGDRPADRPTSNGCGRSRSPAPRPAWLEGRLDAARRRCSRRCSSWPSVPARHRRRRDRAVAAACRAASPSRRPAPPSRSPRGSPATTRAAAAGFRRMGCPYEAASALADTGDTSSLPRGAGDVRAPRRGADDRPR